MFIVWYYNSAQARKKSVLFIVIALLWKKWDYTGFTLSFRNSMVWSFCEHFVSTQYLENELTESDQILYAHQHWQDLTLDCYPLLLVKFWRSYGPWLTPEFHFRSISWKWLDRIRPNFVCTSTLTRSSLGLFFAKFWQSYSPWLTSEFRFRSISWEPINRIRPNFVCASTLTRSSLGLLPVIFRKISTELRPLVDVGILWRTNWQNLTKFCIHINIDKV